MKIVQDIRHEFAMKYQQDIFIVDKSGTKVIELLGASFIANENAIFGTPNQEYIDKEIAWYQSQSTNIYDINKDIPNSPPAAWMLSASKHGEINSNYGKLIFSRLYHNQYDNVLEELRRNPNSRRACMIYNRPSIWEEYKEDGKSDFICTNAVHYYIREDKLHCAVQMRSNDAVYGYKNDYAWQKYVLNEMVTDLKLLEGSQYDQLVPGNIFWQVANLHLYERHFDFVKTWIKTGGFI